MVTSHRWKTSGKWLLTFLNSWKCGILLNILWFLDHAFLNSPIFPTFKIWIDNSKKWSVSLLFDWKWISSLQIKLFLHVYHNIYEPFLCWVCRRTPRISYNILLTFLCWICRRTPRIKAEGELGRKSRRFSLGTGPNKLSKSRSVPELQPAEEYKLRKEKQKEYVLKICIDSANS